MLQVGVIQLSWGALKLCGLDLEDKLVAFGSDRAAVTIGRCNGIAALLKQVAPWVKSLCGTQTSTCNCSSQRRLDMATRLHNNRMT